MQQLLSCQSVSKTHGNRQLFKDISMGIQEGDKIGLIGPNGSGKSTFLKILYGIESPDTGERSLRKWTEVAYVPQVSEFPAGQSIRQIVYAAITNDKLDELERTTQVEITLSRVGFEDNEQQAEVLSGGWKKRLSIACALVNSPDVLLLDEPTNHLDLEGILWLEELLKSASFAYLVISHDRIFLENVARRVIELNPRYPEGILSIDGNYSQFLLKKDEFLQVQQQIQESLESKVRREVEWLRRGPKARTTKARFRIEQAGKLIEDLSEVKGRNQLKHKTDIDFTSSDRKSKELLVAKHVAKALGGKVLFEDLSFVLSPRQCLGLVGPNGSGKTTLIRLLTGELEPDSGTIKRADGLKVVHFSQNREELDLKQTLRRALVPDGGDSVQFRDRSYHVASWAQRFLFRTEQLGMQVGLLSGGERARILIARLMLEPADLLILDEPTNDLDLPTLEVLEDNLLGFSGALLLVTHDRYMLDRVSTTVLGLNGKGKAEFFADYYQWEEARKAQKKAEKKQKTKSASPPPSQNKPKKRLSYMEKREFDELEPKIMELEETLEEVQAEMSSQDVVSDSTKLQACYERSEELQKEIETLYARWAELEEKMS